MGQSGRSQGVELGSPNGLRMDDSEKRKWTVMKSKSGRSLGMKADGPEQNGPGSNLYRSNPHLLSQTMRCNILFVKLVSFLKLKIGCSLHNSMAKISHVKIVRIQDVGIKGI